MNPESMDMEPDHAESVIEKSDTKLSFSIESLLANKFDSGARDKEEYPSTSALSTFSNSTRDSEVHCDSDDESNQSSENVDVDGSGGGDGQDYLDEKHVDYQQSGSSISRGKRARTAFSAQQIKSLEAEFEKNRLPPTQQQQWMKTISNVANTNPHNQIIDRNMFRALPKPDIPPFMISPPYANERVFNLERSLSMHGNVKIPTQNRIVPREVYNNMATAQRNLDMYKNNILNHNSPPQESNVDHLRRLEENFSI
ncbi:unnamed protein product [Diatraea saccharalis]|uniref:Homeobox domain-containing protein n=1 Tax=Diatraea saccharalis TaxID=40085 RepID=A0A9N9WIG6_9NEOP|nr:unnamed protein product [Diatraea saccharalis]